MNSDELSEAIGEIRELLATIAAGCRPCREQVGKLDEIVRGNGDGHNARLARLETHWKALLFAMPLLAAFIGAVISKVL